MSKSMKVLTLAGVLWLAVASAAQAGGNGGVNGGDHASAAPACSDKCPVLAGGASGAGGDIRGSLTGTARSGQIPRLWRPVLAGDGPPGVGERNGRSAALSQGGGEYRVAASKPNSGGDINP